MNQNSTHSEESMKYIPRAPMLSAKTSTTWRGREKEKRERGKDIISEGPLRTVPLTENSLILELFNNENNSFPPMLRVRMRNNKQEMS